ncbi:MAG: PAC2 family protein, partial [Candidatus Micrarchaeaceae archaeon]
IRVYASEKAKIVTIFAEFAMPLELTRDLADSVYSMIKETGIVRVFSIGGMPLQNAQSAAFAIASSPSLLKEAQKAGLKPIGEGVATGVSALLLARSTIDGFSNTNIMVAIDQTIINPKYAKTAIESLKKLIKLNIDTSDLDKEAKLVEEKIKEIIKKHAESHDTYKKTVEGAGPSMYA